MHLNIASDIKQTDLKTLKILKIRLIMRTPAYLFLLYIMDNNGSTHD